MSRLSRRIREHEAAIGADRRHMAAAVAELRAGVRRRISSPGALCAAFGGGLVLGVVSAGRARSRAARSAVSPQAGSPRVASSRGAPMVIRLAREVLWPIGVGALQAQLGRLLAGGEASPPPGTSPPRDFPRDSQRR